MKRLTVLAGVTALMALAAPPAFAGVAAPEDAAGCTTTYVDAMGGPWMIPFPVIVTYTPPATVSVDGSPGVNFAGAFARYTVNATRAYVDCLV